MEPITTGLLLAGGAQLLAGVGKAAGQYMANRPLESQVARIEELKRLQEANALGLTGAEQSAYMASFVDPQRAIAAQQMQQSQANSPYRHHQGQGQYPHTRHQPATTAP